MSFHPGQRVVCVDDIGQKPICTVVKGRVYTVAEYFVTDWRFDRPDMPAIRLEEFVYPVSPLGSAAHSATRFRPLDESRLDVFRAHLVTPPKQKVKALAP